VQKEKVMAIKKKRKVPTNRKAPAKRKAAGKRKVLVAPRAHSEFTTRHFKAIHEGLRNAGLSNFKIESLVLKPVTASADVQSDCHAVPTGDGGYTIKC
jgi:hypothetical protein